MSKSKKNGVDPLVLLDTVGADATRWYFYTGSAPWLSSRLSIENVQESQRGFLATLWNVYSFYVLYAEIDKFNPLEYKDFVSENIMDKWIISKLNTLVGEVDKDLEKYDITGSALKIEDFVDELSNWYVRRNRNRFWGNELTDDKLGAFVTLYRVLVTISKVIAPFVPFIAEEIYQNLVRSLDKEAVESVHLCLWPDVDSKAIDKKLEKEMDLAYELVKLGRSARNSANIKNRQPLSNMLISLETLPKYYGDIIKDELNVKNVELGADLSKYVNFEILPNLPVLGKAYGKLIPGIKAEIAKCNQMELASKIRNGEKHEIQVNGETIELDSENLLVTMKGKEGFAFAGSGTIGVLIDTTITEELKVEGYVREIISKVQNLRKEKGFEVLDRIYLYISGNEMLEKVVEDNKELIKKETLSLEIIIREKIKALSNELGEKNDKNEACTNFMFIIDGLKVSEKIKTSMRREVNVLESTLETSPEYGSLRTHLEFITSLPWNKSSKDETDIEKIDNHLNELHYGLDKAKERIEEYMALRKKNKSIYSPVLCLIGPPGTGKTTFARELASSTHREFVKVSVGGLNDASELVGHRRTYIGAGPGKIMEGIRKCGVNNPIILIDEVDKMVKDYKGDPSSILLDILDQNQNKEFVDNYVQEPFDLSDVLFILTANDESKIPRALYDRLEVIEVASYTIFDKVEIAKHYTLPRLGKEYGFDYKLIKIPESVITKIVEDYTKEAGVRELERKITSIIRKILIKGLNSSVTIKENELEKYLGKDKFSNFTNMYTDYGVVNVPACTNSGGCILNIEVSLYQGNEKIISTGSLGKTMQESALVALSYLKDNNKSLKLDIKKFTETLHIHALDGATPKDGPSAGLGIAVAIASELLKTKVPNEIAFSGEISLKGRILKVGGIKEKVISSYNSGIQKIYIPSENLKDIEKIPKKILKNIEIIAVNTFTEVYNDIFE